MSRARVGALLVFAALVMVLAGTPARAQGRPARLDLVAQTTFVGDDPAVIDVRVLGAPSEAVVTVRIHEAVTTREGLMESIAGEPPTGVIGRWSVDDLDEVRVGVGDVISLAVPDEEIGELLRRPSDAGPHPIVIELVDGDQVLDSLVTHLLVRPPVDDGAAGPRLTVALVLDLALPLMTAPDGSAVIDGPALETAGELASTLAARVELPLTVRLSPEAFETLATTGNDEPLATIRTASVGNSVLLSPWAELDEEAWRAAGRSDLVVASYQRGRDALEDAARVEAGNVVALDGTTTADTISLLTAPSIGATGFILDDDGVLGVPGAITGPVLLEDAGGGIYPAVLPDGFLGELATGSDPELAVQNTLAELLRLALADPTGSGGVVLAPRNIDLVALDLLLDGLDRPSPLVPGTVEEVLALPEAELVEGQPIRARLTPTTTEDLSATVEALAEVETRLDAYSSLINDREALIEPLRTILLASTADSASDRRDAYIDTVSERVDAGLQGVELVDTGRITITSRRASLPIVVRNDQTQPILVALVLSAEKIDFPAGERQVMVLDPGENEISLEVVALASGDSVINLDIETPDGGVELAAGVVRLRSTAISGLGLLISVIALAVLIGWWIQTIRRRRRARRDLADSVASPGHTGNEKAEGHPAVEGTK